MGGARFEVGRGVLKELSTTKNEREERSTERIFKKAQGVDRSFDGGGRRGIRLL